MKIVEPKSRQPIPKNAKRVFKGVVFDVYQWQQKMFDGSYKTFEKLKRNDTVLILAITAEGKIVLTKQKQPGKEPFTDFIGGSVDDGETILGAAKRELLEEAGMEAKEFELLDAVQPASKIETAFYMIIAKGCTKVAEQDLDPGEDIKLFYVTPEQFLQIITQGDKKLNFQGTEITSKLLREKILKLDVNKNGLDKFKKLLS